MSTSQVKASNVHSPRQLWREFQLFSWPPSSEILALGDLGSDSVARPGVGESRLRGFCNSFHSRGCHLSVCSIVLTRPACHLPHACTTMHVHAHVVRYLHAYLCNVTCRCTLGHAGHDSMTLCRFIFRTEVVHACIHIHVRACCMLHVHIHVHVQGRTHTYRCMLHHVHVHVQDRNHT